jgi:HTH-type transcriptional regulator, competence development regulator
VNAATNARPDRHSGAPEAVVGGRRPRWTLARPTAICRQGHGTVFAGRGAADRAAAPDSANPPWPSTARRRTVGDDAEIWCDMSAGLGAFIRQRRSSLGLTQESVADQAGIGRSHLSQIESGKIGLPNATIRRRLAKTLRVRHIDLLVAAGEISEDEVRSGAAPQPSELDEIADRLSLDAREALLAVARQLARIHQRANGQASTRKLGSKIE